MGREIGVGAGDRHGLGGSHVMYSTDDSGITRIHDVDDLQSVVPGPDISTASRDGHTAHPTRRVHAAHGQRVRRIGDIDHREGTILVQPFSNVGVGAHDGQIAGRVTGTHAAHDPGARWIRDVDHLETAGVVGMRAGQTGVTSRDGHINGPGRAIHAAHDPGIRRIGNVDHLETGVPVRHVCVGARDRHAVGEVRRVHASHDPGTGGVRDIDHVESSRPGRDIGVGAGNRHAKGIVPRVHGTDDSGILEIGDVDHLEPAAEIGDVGEVPRDDHILGPVRQGHAAHPVDVILVVDAVSSGRSDGAHARHGGGESGGPEADSSHGDSLPLFLSDDRNEITRADANCSAGQSPATRFLERCPPSVPTPDGVEGINMHESLRLSLRGDRSS